MNRPVLSRRSFLHRGLAAARNSLPRSAIAQGREWVLLGTRSVSLLQDRDIVPVTFLQGSFSRLLLRVRDNAIFMNDVIVTFTNGETAYLAVRFLIPAGGQTRAIDLPGLFPRFVRTVELRYRTVPNFNGRAIVEVWGLR
jgi:hypothetical protein